MKILKKEWFIWKFWKKGGVVEKRGEEETKSMPHAPVYQLRNFFIPKIIVDFRTDLHKMKINTELCCKRYDFLTKKTQNYRYQNYCLDDNIQIYSYGLLCEHVLSMRTV